MARWGLTFTLAFAALGIRLTLARWLEPNKLVTFYPAIAGATLIGGWSHGVFALAFSAVAAWYFLFEPRGPFAPLEQNASAILLAFLFVSGLLIWIVATLRKSVQSLEAEVALRHLAEKEALKAKWEADRASVAKSKFLATASHDLRQPVQSLTMLMAALKHHEVDAAFLGKTVALMERSLNGLNKLLNGVLDVSRLDAGSIVPQIAPMDLGDLLTQLAGEYQPIAENKGLKLKFSPQGGKLLGASDPVLLGRILRNLIENAIRYTAKGGVSLRLRREQGAARIDIIDTGIGIPSDRLGEIFEEFTQLQNPAGEIEKGLGLGLAIVARLAKLLGIVIDVRSKVGRGSRFSLILPLSLSIAAPTQNAAEGVTDATGNVLIIEDNQLICAGYETMLAGWGYQVTVAHSGEEAIELTKNGNTQFDALIADYRLGAGISGSEAAAKISDNARRPIPTLILTGDTAEDRISEVIRLGFKLLHKPIGADDLRRELASLTARKDAGPAM